MLPLRALVLLAVGATGLPTTTEEAPANSGLIQPKISYSRETISKPGEDVVVDCGVEGIDLTGVEGFNIAWSKIDLEKPTNSYPISNGENVVLFSSKYQVVHPENSFNYNLKILNIDEDDTGTYRCTVNFGDNQKINAEVPVLIEKPPYFLDPSTKTLTVTEGDAISIDCQPGGSPKPTVFWERVNHELPFYGGNFFKDNQLDIPLVAATHEGHYVCHADNGLGVPATSEVILVVQYAPKVKVSDTQIPAEMAQEVSFECNVDAFPEAGVAWYKGGEEILGDVNIRINRQTKRRDQRSNILDEQLRPNKPDLVTSTLTIGKVRAEDFGTYSCVAISEVGSSNSSVNVTLKAPPKIEAQSPRKIFYNDEEALGRDSIPVSIDCHASGVPTPEYKWLKNNKPLVWQTNPRMSMEPNTGSLLIEEPTPKDNGWYQCVAFNELGVAKSDPVYLLNSTRVNFEKGQTSVTLEAEEGRPFTMKCPNATGDPAPNITWVLARTKSADDGNIQMRFMSSNRTIVGPDGSAYFSHIIKEDDSEVSSIKYICVGSHSALPHDYSMGTTVELKVVPPKDGVLNGEKDNLNIEPFLMYGSPNVTSFTGNKDNKLWCIFGGEPEPEIRWERIDGVSLETEDYMLDNYNSTLVIKNTNMSHTAEYRCRASNAVGPQANHTMKVVVNQPPVFRNEMKAVTVDEGSSVTFRCDAEGSGVITYSWFFNGRPVVPIEGSRRSVEGNGLTVTRVSITDIGNYACNASSMAGYAYGQTTLNVMPIEGGLSSAGGVCPEVEALRSELMTVKDSLYDLRQFVQMRNTIEAESSLSLIQRIAAKLNILSEEEQKLLLTQGDVETEKISVDAALQETANNRDTPQFLYAEHVAGIRNKEINEEMTKGEEDETTPAPEEA